jgi:hypothetical protein
LSSVGGGCFVGGCGASFRSGTGSLKGTLVIMCAPSKEWEWRSGMKLQESAAPSEGQVKTVAVRVPSHLLVRQITTTPIPMPFKIAHKMRISQHTGHQGLGGADG